jgi:hypothetical protein
MLLVPEKRAQKADVNPRRNTHRGFEDLGLLNPGEFTPPAGILQAKGKCFDSGGRWRTRNF